MTNYTPEQQAFIAKAQSSANILLSAVAGSGKTTALKAFAKKLPPRPTLALAFNKRNQQDLEKAMPSLVLCKTFNALGHGIWAKHTGSKLSLDARKSGTLIKNHCENLTKAQFTHLIKFLDALRSAMIIPQESDFDSGYGIPWDQAEISGQLADIEWEACDNSFPDLWRTAHKLLRLSIKESFRGRIDFADQIYLPLVALPASEWPSFSCVLVDEAQDLSPANQEALARLVRKPRSRLIAVGDRAQAIYGFRGADTRSMDTLRARFDMHEMPLSVTFRCATSIVEKARKRLPDMQPRADAPAGQVCFDATTPWSLSDVPRTGGILCRNNAPLFSLALRLLRARIPLTLLGRNMEAGLVKIMSQISARVAGQSVPSSAHKQAQLDRAVNNMDEALAQLDAWLETERQVLEANNQERLVARIIDQYACIHTLFDDADSIHHAKEILSDLFQSSGALTLSTIHRSKGFEWDEVWLLEPYMIPSKYAQEAADLGDPEPLQQERNLQYVAWTRAKTVLRARCLEHMTTEGAVQ